jgi:hypothetical protein
MRLDLIRSTSKEEPTSVRQQTQTQRLNVYKTPEKEEQPAKVIVPPKSKRAARNVGDIIN